MITFFSVSPAVHGRSARARSARELSRSTSVWMVGVSGVSTTRAARGVVDRQRRGSGHPDGLGVGRVVAVRAAHVGVLADLERHEELLAGRSAHRPGHRRDDHVRQPEPLERALVGVAMGLVADHEPIEVEIEAVRVLHHELATAQQAGTRPGLVAELRLDLEDAQRQVLVAAVQVLDEEGEHLLMGGGEHEVGALAVLDAEHAVAVLGPPSADLVRLARQQRREVHLLEAGGDHLLAHDALDVAQDLPPERQEGEPAGGGATDVAGTHQEAVAGHFGVGRILPQGAHEEGRHPEHLGHVDGHYRPRPVCSRASLKFGEPKAWTPWGPRLLRCWRR